jgi:membrane fusion protein (multidrug efflux system)
MVRVMIKTVVSHVAPVVPQEAVLADRQGDFVYIVDASNVAHQRRITLGTEVGVMTEVLSGLQAGENIVLRGIQSMRPDAPVNPVSMKREGEAKTPAELAMQSGYDVQMVSSDAK